MNEKESFAVKKKHKFLDAPVIGPLLLFVYAEGMSMILGALLYAFVPAPAFYFANCLTALVIIVIHRLWFKDYRGGLFTKYLGDRKFWILFLIMTAIDAAACFYDMTKTGFVVMSLEGFGSALMAGICEEIGSRYLLVSVMMRRYKEKNSFMPVLLFTAITFGLSHYINISSAEDFWPVTLQVIMTMGAGFAMGVLFLRTGNILVPICWHTFHDCLCHLEDTVESTAVQNTIFAGVSVSDLVECGAVLAVYIIFALLMLKGQRENIQNVWKDRWSEPEA